MRVGPVVKAVVLLLVVAACSNGGVDVSGEPTPTPTSETGSGDLPSETPTASPLAPTATATSAQPAGLSATQIAAGDQHACALDEEGRAWCWGYNRSGQLGDGTATDRDTPAAVASQERFASIVAGRSFTCGLTEAGQAWCWGDNSRGQLGDGTSGAGSADEDRSSPVAVDGGPSFTSLVAGQLHVCGLTSAGEAYCWGAYGSGQLGNDASGDQTSPGRSAEELIFSTLAPGGDTHTCGLTEEGTAWCWGSNNAGQLGDDTTTNARQPEPREVIGGHRFRAMVLGSRHTCALDMDGAAWCWGANHVGQLGDGTTETRPEPVQVTSDTRFESISAGDAHTCATTATGAAHCWGSNAFGQLGTTDRAEMSATPVTVDSDVAFAALSAAEEFTCGLATDGTVLCWGSNRSGWLGNGTRDPSRTPTAVTAP